MTLDVGQVLMIDLIDNPYIQYVETFKREKNFFAKGTFEIAEDTPVTLFVFIKESFRSVISANAIILWIWRDFFVEVEGISRNNPYNPLG